MDPRAINKTIELYKARAEKIRAEYRERQQAQAAEQAGEAKPEGQAEPMQTQDTHQQEANA